MKILFSPRPLLFILFVGILVCVVTVGCFRYAKQETPPVAMSGTGKALQSLGAAPAALAVSEPMRPFFAAGLGFIVLGGITLCLGGRGTGFILMGLGIGCFAGIPVVPIPCGDFWRMCGRIIYAAVLRITINAHTLNGDVMLTTLPT